MRDEWRLVPLEEIWVGTHGLAREVTLMSVSLIDAFIQEKGNF